MERRKLTKEDIDKVRDIEGFPIGSDEDIIALSDAPYYTACPNPFIEDFIREYGTPYDEETDDYHREPFSADVSEGKTDPIYMAHSYHTKVPHKAIMQYILHYTNPGDIVFDGFCGTGMTGVAAQMCESPDIEFANKMSKLLHKPNWGARKVILNDLSPAATFIASNYNTKIDKVKFYKEVKSVIDDVEKDTEWMYITNHKYPSLGLLPAVGHINYTIWSDVFICPNCGKEIVYWDMAIDEKGNMLSSLHCPYCGVEIKKSKCERAQEYYYDDNLGSMTNFAKQVPVLINYSYGGKRYDKKPDEDDIALIEKIKQNANSEYWYPRNKIPTGVKTSDPINLGITNVNLFYTSRNLYVLSELWEKARKTELKNQIWFCITSILIKTASKLHNVGIKNGKINLAGAMPNALFIPSILAERNIITLLKGKVKDITPVFDFEKSNDNFIISSGSSTDLSNIPNNCIDYIFVDPPFGDNLMYSELSFIWEAWLKVLTNNKTEAIINKSQNKGVAEYQELFSECFSEFFRIIKPNRWITVEFHNSKNAVWMAINEAIQRAGFIISYVKTLNKGQGSYNQQTALGAVKQDLVISAYKPKESFKREFESTLGTEDTAWAFVRQHLENVPVVVISNGKIEIVSERQAYLLFDRMVAYHIMNGISVPLDATDFYRGLDEKFIKRDGMYFLADQVNEYDTTRIKTDIEPIQFSLFITNEKTAISWLYQQLSDDFNGPQTYAELQPKFMQEVKSVDKFEDMPELSVLLEENFLQDEKGRWYIPDTTKEGDVAKLREKKLWKEFEGYMNSKGKLKLFRSEAIRIGFSRLWKDKNYKAIVDIAERLPEQTIQEDTNLLMYYDISLSRI